MRWLRTFRNLFAVPADNPELARSQLAALSKQIPLLYFILIANTVAISITHYGIAPFMLTVKLPFILYIACIVRTIHWRHERVSAHDGDDVIQRLRSTVWLAFGMGAGCTIWSLSLYPYGGPFEQGHVAFYMALTVVGCIFCLIHLRAAALALTTVVLVPYTIFFVMTGNHVLIAIAMNMLLVAAAMIYVLLAHDRDFSSLIETQKQLLARQSESQRLSDENFRLANVDSLTGLPNRRSFFGALNIVLENSRHSHKPFAVGLIDLDGFKAVNDLYGHAIGDRLLIEASARLRENANDTVIVARLGGDEFGIIVKDELTSEALMDFGRTLCNGLSVPYDISKIATEVSASAGFVIYPEGGQTVEMLMEHADYALYHAKSVQRGAPVIFSHRDVTEMHTLTLVDQRLRLADLESELWLAYQPIVDLRYGATTGFEALARWTSPTAGSIPPDIFIRAAERSEMVNRITELLFRRALREARTWPQPLGISFNLSARNIATDETMLRLIAIINESGIDASRIDLEITESVLMADFENAVQKLQALRNLGVKISLDDFGTGYSSLSYVHRLQFDKIKIDRGFIAGIEADPKSVNVIRTVVDLCRNLNLTSVVEGVETAEQVRIVSDLQCDLMQGYYAGRPMPAKEICSFLEVERRRLARPHLARSA